MWDVNILRCSCKCGDISSFSYTSCDSCAVCPGNHARNVGWSFACSYRPYLNKAPYKNLHFLRKTRQKKPWIETSAPKANVVTASTGRAGRVGEKFSPRRDVTPVRRKGAPRELLGANSSVSNRKKYGFGYGSGSGKFILFRFSSGSINSIREPVRGAEPVRKL